MLTFAQFLDNLDQKNGFFPEDKTQKLIISTSNLYVLYIKELRKTDGRMMKWHFDRAIELYVTNYTNDNR